MPEAVLTRNPADYYLKKVHAIHPTKGLPELEVCHNVDRFDLYNDRLYVGLPDWTETNFRNYGEKLGLFDKSYQLDGEAFVNLYGANQAMIDGIKGIARALCGAPDEADFRYFRLHVTDRMLEMNFHLNGVDFPKNFYGDAYNALVIQNEANSSPENPSLVRMAAFKSFEIAATIEPEYWENAEDIT